MEAHPCAESLWVPGQLTAPRKQAPEDPRQVTKGLPPFVKFCFDGADIVLCPQRVSPEENLSGEGMQLLSAAKSYG
jgi:hypothetical protein